jgi:hypothetical protein
VEQRLRAEGWAGGSGDGRGEDEEAPESRGKPSPFFDADGCLHAEPDPLDPALGRSVRAFDPLADYTQTWFSTPQVSAGVEEESFRLDLAVGRLELNAHALMGREDHLAKALLGLFREFQKRRRAGVLEHLETRLAAAEESLLAAREAVFGAGAQEGGGGAAALVERLLVVEREAAEARQLVLEERGLETSCLQRMEALYQEIEEARRQQGFAATQLNLLLEKDEAGPAVAAEEGSRVRLAARVAVAEDEVVRGLPLPPEPLRAAAGEGGAGFRLRRVESTAAAHVALRAELEGRLEQLSGRASEGEDSPEARNLRSRLLLLGPAPERESGPSGAGGGRRRPSSELSKPRGRRRRRSGRARVSIRCFWPGRRAPRPYRPRKCSSARPWSARSSTES